MSASVIPLLTFVRDMERCAVAPFGRGPTGRLLDLAYDMREAAVAGDAKTIAHCLRATRLERLWALEAWAWARSKRHPRIWLWLTTQLRALKALDLDKGVSAMSMTKQQRIDDVAAYLIETYLAGKDADDLRQRWPGLTEDEYDAASAAAWARLINERLIPRYGARAVAAAMLDMVKEEGSG